ncbi:ABC transporter ATP-binding protein [Enterocloster bolteae]|uniref:ABC transporter ATP-binding protein n=1 Tax=Enterocloster bolteae TaxID=208479 RepID=UPI002ED554DC
MIEFKNVSFQYEGSEQQIWNVNLSIAQGECVVLTGVSGCGKTTLTRLMNGLAPSYFKGSISGSICIDDRDITGMTAWEIGTIVGSVFQNPKSQFFSSELVGEVAFGCENHGFSREAIQERTDKSIETFSLSLIRKRPLDVLSSGEKQRVAIASVYAMRPKVFVCDEPTANLDLGGSSNYWERFLS